MATATHVTLAEYLSSDYKPARELVAGELLLKPTGTIEHMRMERKLLRLLEPYEQQGLGQAMHELSVRHGDEIRIPDVVFFANDAELKDGLLLDSPILCIEILSPSQRPSELFAKCEEYHDWGVPYCWVIDPVQKSAWEYHQGLPVRLLLPEGQLSAGNISVAVAGIAS